MMKSFICFIIFLSLLSCSSPNSFDELEREWQKAEEDFRLALDKNWQLSNNHGVLLEPGRMKLTRSLSCDVDIVPRYINGRIGFAFSLFNYGDTIILCKNVWENNFFEAYALNAEYDIINKDDVRVTSVDSLDAYGKYAHANIFTNEGYFRNVLVSPCAYDLLFDYKSSDVLLLCYFYSDYSNGQKMVLYRADQDAEILLRKQANQVCTYFELPLGPDKTWDKIRSEKDQKAWEDSVYAAYRPKFIGIGL